MWLGIMINMYFTTARSIQTQAKQIGKQKLSE